MSIIIKGMKMPERMDILRFNTDLNGEMKATNVNDEAGWFEVVELPSHGRLIDADALEAEPCDVVENMEFYSESGYSHTQIQNAPTIIEAEEEKNAEAQD